MFGILIIENDSTIANSMRDWLLEEGYKVDISPSGTKALRQLQDYDYDVAVISSTLPDMEGSELCRKISNSNLELPVIMVSPRPGVEDTIKGLDAGAQDFMTSPFEMPEFSARVRSLLRRYAKGGVPRQTIRLQNRSINQQTTL